KLYKTKQKSINKKKQKSYHLIKKINKITMTEQQNTLINQDKKDRKSMATPIKKSAVTKASKPDNTKPTAIKAKETDEQERTLDTPSTPHPVFIEVNERCLISAEQLKRYTNPDELPTDTRTAPDLDRS